MIVYLKIYSFMKNKKVWIIGASAGIGEALAQELDSIGAKLILSARNIDALNQLNNRLLNNHQVAKLDAASNHEVQEVVDSVLNNNSHVDYIIYMAAIYKDDNIPEYDYDFAKSLIEVNLLGAINLAYKLIPKLENKGKQTQLIYCASVAGYIGLPKGQPYSCSKAAMINFAESLRAELSDSKIVIRIINPGFVKTRLTAKNSFKMPCIISSEQAATYIVKELTKKHFEIHFPKRFTRILKLLRLLPYNLLLNITSRLS